MGKKRSRYKGLKFVLSNPLILLAYRTIDQDTVKLLALGPHENFYHNLKRLSKWENSRNLLHHLCI
ncbi:type II toxin-antitoxin system RelE/ParE family toxin [Nitrosomonas sp. Nm84]|uniref:type II toxin-antitoxin system RelE/ParE family toxin n=1 Tax=Nitrosomonas sp. Nm84 TaxID=200124 RepID=UPI000D77505B|nr:type II toxin-antitoxin system RelE/ParE family toxin [Nitrosomonas sp. Nm84]